MTYRAIVGALQRLINKPTGGRYRHIGGVEVQTVFYPASNSVAVYVEGQYMTDEDQAAALIYQMHRQSGIA